ncbi:unnamed protein product [Ceratitis capitata]|uniref:(Mediterranean fruit fly) hypothetical protein n=1 Tax=Ceratitis capitata TaxID=7213 RepID=A0A811VKS4_CERCA|nr:unnamed protein product [Ceratitis capitata]
MQINAQVYSGAIYPPLVQNEALKVVSGSSAIAARVSSDHLTAGCTAYNSEAQSQSQSESRIRVRDWLMLADQSILQKTIDQQPDKSLITSTNETTNTITSAAEMAIEDASTHIPSSVSAAIVPLGATTVVTASTTSSTKQPTLMRIGSIGRTTITCVAPRVASNDTEINLLNNGNMGVISAAALAAAGVELESVDESMTEVLVKIENSSSSTQDEDMDMDMEAEGDENGEGDFIGEEEQQTGDSGKEPDFNYELKLSSPMSWAFDTVKIENEEEFEDILSGENDTTNTEDEDDLLTTAAATTKQAAVNSSDQQPTASLSISPKETTESLIIQNPSSNSSDSALLKCKQRGVGKRRTHIESKQETSLPSVQQQLLLLEQQQHLQHLQLRPTQQTLQFKLASIPATITSFTTTTTTAAAATASNNDSSGANEDNVTVGTDVGAEPNSKQDSTMGHTNKNTDFKSSVSDDKRYRILVQNQRMRKESLEHSEDMIYNADIEKPWVCRNCNRNYKWKNSLKCHLKNECGQPPRYFCSKLCGYATNVHSNLKRHLNTKCRDRMEEDQKTNTSTYTLVFQQNE